jgi:hypothetical protein
MLQVTYLHNARDLELVLLCFAMACKVAARSIARDARLVLFVKI